MNGQSNGVISYVNTHGHVESEQPNYVFYQSRRVWTGEKWQCVEYVRRYLLLTRGLTFPSVPNAYAIASLRKMWNVRRGSHPSTRWYHAHSHHRPRRGDLLVMRDGVEDVNGHVGIIHAVMDEDANWLAIADQNAQMGRYWQFATFAYVISRHDPRVIGWLRVQDKST